jgi:hypothetical protein
MYDLAIFVHEICLLQLHMKHRVSQSKAKEINFYFFNIFYKVYFLHQQALVSSLLHFQVEASMCNDIVMPSIFLLHQQNLEYC